MGEKDDGYGDYPVNESEINIVDPAITAGSLSELEQTKLQQLETVINRGKQAFVEVGTALMEIRVKRLYRGEFNTFEEYCQNKWGFSRQFASLQIQSAEIASGLSSILDIPNGTTAEQFISVPAEDRLAVAEQAKAIASEHGRDTINSRDVKEAKASFSQAKTIPTESDLSGLTEDQQRRLRLAKMGYGQLANQHTDSALIKVAQAEGIYCRIDRNSIWGNPFILDEDGDRETVIANYADYLTKKPSLRKLTHQSLRGRIMGCWCYPEPCHGHILIKEFDI